MLLELLDWLPCVLYFNVWTSLIVTRLEYPPGCVLRYHLNESVPNKMCDSKGNCIAVVKILLYLLFMKMSIFGCNPVLKVFTDISSCFKSMK